MHRQLKVITYTIKSEETGQLFTVATEPENLKRELREWSEFLFILDGVDGVNGYVSPTPDTFLTHFLEDL